MQKTVGQDKAHSVREAVYAAMWWHPDGDFWKNYLDEPLASAHTRNSLTANDYLDDMSWAERRRSNGHSPMARAMLDMPL